MGLLHVPLLRSLPCSRTVSSSGRPWRRLPNEPASRSMGGPGSWLTARAAAAASLVLLAGACSSDDDTADTTPVASAPSPPSTVPTTRPTEPSTSTVVATSSVTTAPAPTPSSDGLPTTSVEPAPDLDTAIRQAIAAATDAFTGCLLALPACDPATLVATRDGPILAINTDRVEEWNAAGYEVRDRDQFRYIIESVEIDPAGDAAIAIVCVADGSKLVLPGAGPGSTDVIVDGTYVSGRESWDMRLGADGVWRVYDAPALGPTESSDVCPPG